MNNYILIAGVLCFALGIAHSILGEYLIFHSKRKKGKLVPTITGAKLKERHLRILWATWHLASIFGWCISATLIKIATLENQHNIEIINFMLHSITYTMLLTSALVLIGTKGKHPGWTVLLIIGILIILGY